MKGFTIRWMGEHKLADALIRKSATDFKQLERRNILALRNRAVKSQDPSQGGTPVDSNELRLSATVSPSGDEFGYTTHYAPHVEYGHRTRDGGFEPGQYFLRTNVEIQRPLFRKDLIDEIRK